MKNKKLNDTEINDLLEEIFIKYRKQIYLSALKYLRDESLAEDIVQDTMIRVRAKIVKKDITSCHKLGVLMGYIVRGLCLNLLNKNQKVIYRDIFIMKFVKDMSYKEIANDLNLNEATVRKRMERARKKVKQIWSGENDE